MITAGPANHARLAAVEELRAGEIASPQHDATELLAFVLGISRGLLPMADDLTPAQAQRYAELVRRRRSREPLQHIVGTAGFYGLELQVGPGVFIPRPETEVLVTEALETIAGTPEPVVIDLCSGSGAIAVAIAVHRPTARVVAVEQSAQAVTWLRRNAEQLAARVQVVHGDALGELPAEVAPRGADLVTCNPPYVPVGTTVETEVGVHDPPVAVFADHDGLALLRPLVPRIAALLRPGGAVLLEHDESHQGAVLDLLHASDCYEQVEGLRDLTGRPRFVRAIRRDDHT